MLDAPDHRQGGLRAEQVAPLPVARLITGKGVSEAADLLPRLFNLCRTAQSAAARLAFGLPLLPEHAEEMRREVLREHLIRFCLKFPAHFGACATPFPDGWQNGGDAVAHALFGPRGVLPESKPEFDAFLERGEGVGGILAKIRDCFAPGEAASGVLHRVTPANALTARALENSVAARQAERPALRAIEATFGRGPLWRASARAYDAQACLTGDLPAMISPRPGLAIVPAARGTYAIEAEVRGGIVTAFHRVTPTDHLLAKGGILDQVLASLPSRKSGMASLVLDILDPCMPVRLLETEHA